MQPISRTPRLLLLERDRERERERERERNYFCCVRAEEETSERSPAPRGYRGGTGRWMLCLGSRSELDFLYVEGVCPETRFRWVVWNFKF